MRRRIIMRLYARAACAAADGVPSCEYINIAALANGQQLTALHEDAWGARDTTARAYYLRLHHDTGDLAAFGQEGTTGYCGAALV
jgi:hypothetical protein